MCILHGTKTGRFKSSYSNIVELPKGANYSVTTNRAELAAAIKAVCYDVSCTVIDAVDSTGKILARFKFKTTLRNPEDFEKHLRTLARQVMKTPVEVWR